MSTNHPRRAARVRLLTATAMVTLLANCSSADDTSAPTSPASDSGTEPTEIILTQGAEVYTYDSLAQLIASADVVVRGTVVGDQSGPQLDGGRTVREVLLHVAETYRGDVGIDSTIAIDTGAGWDTASGLAYRYEPIPWLVLGDEVIAFLIEPAGRSGDLEVIGSNGIVLRDGELTRTEHHTRIGETLTAFTWPELLSQMTDAAAEAASGRVSPAADPTLEDPAVHQLIGDPIPVASTTSTNGTPWTLVAAPSAGGLCYDVVETGSEGAVTTLELCLSDAAISAIAPGTVMATVAVRSPDLLVGIAHSDGRARTLLAGEDQNGQQQWELQDSSATEAIEQLQLALSPERREVYDDLIVFFGPRPSAASYTLRAN